MSAYGVLGYGAYIPKMRMPRAALLEAIGWAQPGLKNFASGARAFAAWDEDAVTMAVEAARRASAGVARPPARLVFASTTAPFLDRQNAGIVAAALDLSPDTHCMDVSGSQRAALSALCVREDGKDFLLAASDKRPTKPGSVMELLSGDGGAALLMGDGPVLARLVGVNSVYADFVDHFRTAASGTDYGLEERWWREEGVARLAPEAANPLLKRAGISAKDIDRLIAPLANPALASAAADAIGTPRDRLADPLFADCGHTGAAHPILMLAAALDAARPGEKILALAFGQGCDAALFEATDRLATSSCRGAVSRALAARREETNYARFLSAGGRLEIDFGMRAERDARTAQTVAYAKSRDIYGFVGGRCSACATPQFPKSRRCVNPDCTALDTQEDYRFADRVGAVKTFTEDWIAFTRDPPLVYGNVAFDGGGNVFMEMTGVAPGDISIGSRVAMQFRIKDIDSVRGFHRYFWKASTVRGDVDG